MVTGPEPNEELVAATAGLFQLMGDPTRVRLLYGLLDDGEQRVGTLAEGVGVSESAVSHALRLLPTPEVVTARRDGQAIHYRLADPHVRQQVEIMREDLLEELDRGPRRHDRRVRRSRPGVDHAVGQGAGHT